MGGSELQTMVQEKGEASHLSASHYHLNPSDQTGHLYLHLLWLSAWMSKVEFHCLLWLL